jgi:hypothetical protein
MARLAMANLSQVKTLKTFVAMPLLHNFLENLLASSANRRRSSSAEPPI